ncbi:Kinase-like protein [Mycena sanguinolenta]|uniref:non-specific serine/threonine protein kinase n=1 Tax=Mycena sanguinolenta TaxID=230812 RepID=A0A8H6Z236_9AGAR|nr:Kinase-like protein [Mycena sanguinolenta]
MLLSFRPITPLLQLRVGAVSRAIWLSGVRARTRLLHASSAPQYQEEPQDEYRPGGFHPMEPGEIVHDDYKVMRKLGWGEYSMVWLAKSALRGHVALKVMKAEVTDIPELHESEYLHRVLTADPSHPGFRHNLHLLDQFYICGPNGRHLCFVTELLGENLHQYANRFPQRRIPMAIVKSILRQVILATMYLHDKCKIIHTDIKNTNILLAHSIPGSGEVLSSPTVKLIDLGVSCWADRVEEHFSDLIQSPELRAPEVAVGAGWGKPADVWSLGCLAYELAMGKFMMQKCIEDICVPYFHAAYFGPHPPSLKSGKFRDVFFKEDGSLKHTFPHQFHLATRIRRCLPQNMDTEGLIHFLDLILCLDPRDRASLQTLMEHPWLSST